MSPTTHSNHYCKCNSIRFESDSFVIGIDNHASRTISNNKSHFVGRIRRIDRKHVKGIDGQLSIKGIGTIEWKIADDDGVVHRFRIPNSFFVPGIDQCVMSPQHWIQEENDHFPRPHDTKSTTLGDVEVMT